jgi:hypothetical protein
VSALTLAPWWLWSIPIKLGHGQRTGPVDYSTGPAVSADDAQFAVAACPRQVARFNPLEKLDRPIMKVGQEAEAHRVWDQLSNERNRYLDDVETELIGRTQSKPSDAPTTAYANRLMSAAADGDQQRMEQLCDEEVAATLRDIRDQTKAG